MEKVQFLCLVNYNKNQEFLSQIIPRNSKQGWIFSKLVMIILSACMTNVLSQLNMSLRNFDRNMIVSDFVNTQSDLLEPKQSAKCQLVN